MEACERDGQVARLVAGVTPCVVGGDRYEVGLPCRRSRLLAAELYRAVLREARMAGLYDADEATEVLIARDLWGPEDEERLARTEKDADDARVGLYENWSKPEARRSLRGVLAAIRAEQSRLLGCKHALDHVTCESAAATARVRFLAGASLRRGDGSPHWADPMVDWGRPDHVLESVLNQVAEHRLDEAGIRELARTDPWRSIWSQRQVAGRGVFDAAACDLGEEQRHLLMWSNAYESIREHPECPPEDVAADDDALDGWMIVQKRKRDEEAKRRRIETIVGDRHKDAQEVFLVAANDEDVRSINDFNDPIAKLTKTQRLEHLRRHGKVHEANMPDSAQRIRMELARMEAERHGN